MLIKEKSPILSSEITHRSIFTQRRKIIKAAAGITVASLIHNISNAATKKYIQVPTGPYSATLQTTDFEDVSNYTNFYEFSAKTTGSTLLAKDLKTSPWNVTVEG